MQALAALGFLSPTLLWALLGLPILWWLLRAVPPAAIKRRFPAVSLLLGLKDPETTPDKTPWWLLLLRMMAVGLLILGFAGPVLNPKAASTASGPLLILTDASWASAPDWTQRLAKIDALLIEAGRGQRTVAVLALSDGVPVSETLPLQGSKAWAAKARQLQPRPYGPDYAAFNDWVTALPDTGFDTIWLSDKVARAGRDRLAKTLSSRGTLRVIEGSLPLLALKPPLYDQGRIKVPVLRADASTGRDISLNAYGPDPSGIERLLAEFSLRFAEGETEAIADFDLPSELRNRIRRFEIAGRSSAATVVLADDALKRRKVALFAGQQAQEGQELVSSLHFLRRALAPTAELIEASLSDSLLASPDVVVLADVAKMTTLEKADLQAWVEKGGLLVRFAGPRLAASTKDAALDPLLPVRLRAGGRNVGGAMSWGAPKRLQEFPKSSPFFGLKIPEDVTVSSQVIAQPDPDIAQRTIAALQDGTPLVTSKTLGKGKVILVHVTANAEWSNLPLSGLFVQMLERLAISTRTARPSAEDLGGQIWTPKRVMDGFGQMRAAEDLAGIKGEALLDTVSKDLLPGVYMNGERVVAVNVFSAKSTLSRARWPASITVEGLGGVQEQPLKALLLTLALALLMLDILATLWISGRLSGPRSQVIASALAALVLFTPRAEAQSTTEAEALALRATIDTVLAYVKTGDARLDATSEAGLYGLSQVLRQRTAIEPADPIAVDLELDELAFYPMIYWPISDSQPLPSAAAYKKINQYLRTGGMILFDTRDANLGGFGSGTPNGRRLQILAEGLDIPALEPVPSDHVLTRSFYLLQEYPGRFRGRNVWVEAAPPDAKQIEGAPFRNLNDGVSPVVIGGNDWAAAWATNRQGRALFPVGRGSAGERQREIAYRFGVNLVMYVLTGNYKSDQVHVPALLERLGQ